MTEGTHHHVTRSSKYKAKGASSLHLNTIDKNAYNKSPSKTGTGYPSFTPNKTNKP